MTAATARWPRKRLLLTAVVAFALANTVTAVSTDCLLTMAARFVAGVAAGLAWAMLAGYARRMVPDHFQGRAIALVMAGIPVALSLGVPAGTFLGSVAGWRLTFALMTVLTVVLVGWILALVPDRPDRPGREPGARTPVAPALAVPGVAPVLFVTLVFVLAHTILHTYVAAFLGGVGLGDSVDLVLLLFGAASLVSVWVVGVHIDRRPRALIVASVLLVAAAATALAVLSGGAVPVYAAVVLWGLGWGGVPTLLQTAVTDAGGEAADTAQSVLVTLWNVAMAGGGVAGGVLLARLGPLALPWSLPVLLAPVLVVALAARVHGFPARRAGAGS
nr:MFS transporter [Nocardiopsis lucentensis]